MAHAHLLSLSDTPPTTQQMKSQSPLVQSSPVKNGQHRTSGLHHHTPSKSARPSSPIQTASGASIRSSIGGSPLRALDDTPRSLSNRGKSKPAPTLGRMPSTIRAVISCDASASSLESPCANLSEFSAASTDGVDSAARTSSNDSESQPQLCSRINNDSFSTVRLKSLSMDQISLDRPIAPIPAGAQAQAQAQAQIQTQTQTQPQPQPQPQPQHVTRQQKEAAPTSAPNGPEAETNGDLWDSSVGKAGLGKTGRVINKLVNDNEALKRELKIERIKAEEARQTAKLLEDKMERMAADYESRLLEAQVTKTLLSRKERQVESLSAQVDQEKKKATDALGREKTWRDEMERAQGDAQRRIEAAENKSVMLEGRYNAIAGHWRDQGEEVKRATVKLRREIAALTAERCRDDEKITVLRDLCDQQNSNINDLVDQRNAIARSFDAYKAEQERLLFEIKARARDSDAEHARLLKETQETLDKLKWALNINKLQSGTKKQ